MFNIRERGLPAEHETRDTLFLEKRMIYKYFDTHWGVYNCIHTIALKEIGL